MPRITHRQLRQRPKFMDQIRAGLVVDERGAPALIAVGVLMWDTDDPQPGNSIFDHLDRLNTLGAVLTWVGACKVRDAIAPVFHATLGAAKALQTLDGSFGYMRDQFRHVSRGAHDVNVGVSYYDFAEAAGLDVPDGRWGPDGDTALRVTRNAQGVREVDRSIDQRRVDTVITLSASQYAISVLSAREGRNIDEMWRVVTGLTLVGGARALDRLDRGEIDDGPIDIDLFRRALASVTDRSQDLMAEWLKLQNEGS